MGVPSKASTKPVKADFIWFNSVLSILPETSITMAISRPHESARAGLAKDTGLVVFTSKFLVLVSLMLDRLLQSVKLLY